MKTTALVILLACTSCTSAQKNNTCEDLKQVKLVTKICRKGGTESQKRCEALNFLGAAQRGRLSDIQKLLCGNNTNFILGYSEKTVPKVGFTALIHAAEGNHTEIALLLLKKGSIVNHKSNAGYTAIYFAANNGNQELLQALLKKDADVNIYTYTNNSPLLMAIWKRYTMIAKILLNRDADPNTQTKTTGYFALYFAAKHGDLEIVTDLLNANADYELETSTGVTALATAVAFGHTEVVRTLLEASADVNKLDVYETGPLHRAAYYGYLDIMRQLLSNGAVLDQQNRDKRTPLHLAAIEGQLATVRELLSKCPDNTIKDKNGFNALEAAEDRKIKFLSKNDGGDLNEKLTAIEKVIAELKGYRKSSCS